MKNQDRNKKKVLSFGKSNVIIGLGKRQKVCNSNSHKKKTMMAVMVFLL